MMVEFITLQDINEAVRVNQEDVNFANSYVYNFLKNLGINPDTLGDSVPSILKELAKLTALERACIRLSQSEESVYLEKAKSYREMRRELEENISQKSLGLEVVAFSIDLGRA